MLLILMIAYDRYMHISHRMCEYLPFSQVCERLTGAWTLSLAIFLIYMIVPAFRFLTIRRQRECICTTLNVCDIETV